MKKEKTKIKDCIKKTESIISSLEEDDVCGPLPYLQEAIENLENALEELESY
jgi:hypothetical protein